MKNYLKGIAATILISLATYAVISGIRLTERYVAAKEIEARYFVPDNHPNVMVDKEEKVWYIYKEEIGRFEKLAK